LEAGDQQMVKIPSAVLTDGLAAIEAACAELLADRVARQAQRAVKERAICRSLAPLCFKRRISRTRRIGTLSAGLVPRSSFA
jgi:hypothetical protein